MEGLLTLTFGISPTCSRGSGPLEAAPLLLLNIYFGMSPQKLPRKWRKYEKVRWYLLWTQRWFRGSSHVPRGWFLSSTRSRQGHDRVTVHCTVHSCSSGSSQCLRKSCLFHAIISGVTCVMSKERSHGAGLRLEGHFPLVATMIWSSDIASCQGSGVCPGHARKPPPVYLWGQKMVTSRASPHNTTHFTGY